MITPLIANKRVAIVGGGPVGLTAARLLQRSGATVTVYERDSYATARLLGGTLDIHKQTGQQALRQAGLLDAFYALAKPVDERMLNAKGHVLMERLIDETNRYDQPEIDRPDLRQLLLDSLQPGTVVWDRQVRSLTPNGSGHTIHFENSAPVVADVVIVADGSMSKARMLVTDTLPAYTGTYAIQGEINQPEQTCPAVYNLINKGNLACVEERKTIFVHSKANGHLNYYATFRPTDNWLTDHPLDFSNLGQVGAFLTTLFAGWAPLYGELFAATDTYTGFPLRILLLDKPWKPHANVTLIGDAAHVMPPFGGEGLNMGLRDALLLTTNLTEGHFPDIPSAIAAYEQQMFAYALPVQQGSLLADERIHTQTDNAAERINRYKENRERRNRTEQQIS